MDTTKVALLICSAQSLLIHKIVQSGVVNVSFSGEDTPTNLNLEEEIIVAKLSKKDMEELREFCSLGCEFSGTAETVREIADEVLQENGCHSCQCDDATVIDLDEDVVCTVEDFAREFWEKAVEKILNVVETQGR